MEIDRLIETGHNQAILCIAYNAFRKELFTGSQVRAPG